MLNQEAYGKQCTGKLGKQYTGKPGRQYAGV